jgi:Rod binding domain-containing protein
MKINPLQHSIKASDFSLEQLKGSTALSEGEKIAEVSRQFEAVLLRQILQNAQKTVIPSAYTNDSATNSIYRDLIIEQTAENISQSGEFGLARSLNAELSAQLHKRSVAAPDAKNPAPLHE